jgi:hypothetical protein
MSFSRAINEIASLLTQGGVPSNHAGDVAARLSYALEEYYNFRQAQGNSQEVTDSSSQSSAFRRAFRSPEEYPGGRDGASGADGRWAWAVGKDGKDGEQGDTGDEGRAGRDGITTVIGGGGGGLSIDISKVPCGALESKLKSCGLSTGKDGEDAVAKCKTGKFANLEICSILEQQAIEIGKLRKELDTLKDDVKEIEKQIKNTIDCP